MNKLQVVEMIAKETFCTRTDNNAAAAAVAAGPLYSVRLQGLKCVNRGQQAVEHRVDGETADRNGDKCI